MDGGSTTDTKSLINSVRVVSRGLTIRFLIGSFIGKVQAYLPVARDFRNAAHDMHSFVNEQAKKAVNAVKDPKVNEGDISRSSFVHDFVARSTDPTYQRGVLTVMFFGSNDTTSNMISQIIWDLARAPQSVRKVLVEVGQLQGRLPVWEDLQKMTYLRAVIDEGELSGLSCMIQILMLASLAFRLHSVATQITRSANKDHVLPLGGGPDGKSPMFVKKDTLIWLATNASNHDPAIWGADVEDFRPERFIDAERHDSFIPFS